MTFRRRLALALLAANVVLGASLVAASAGWLALLLAAAAYVLGNLDGSPAPARRTPTTPARPARPTLQPSSHPAQAVAHWRRYVEESEGHDR